MPRPGTGISIQIKGDKELKQLLKDITQTIVRDALPEIALKSASIIEASAKEKVPVRTGALRDSIITELVENSRSTVTIEVGPTEDYGDDVELGGSRKAAQPYLRPAADENEEAVVDALVEELNQLLNNL